MSKRKKKNRNNKNEEDSNERNDDFLDLKLGYNAARRKKVLMTPEHWSSLEKFKEFAIGRLKIEKEENGDGDDDDGELIHRIEYRQIYQEDNGRIRTETFDIADNEDFRTFAAGMKENYFFQQNDHVIINRLDTEPEKYETEAIDYIQSVQSEQSDRSYHSSQHHSGDEDSYNRRTMKAAVLKMSLNEIPHKFDTKDKRKNNIRIFKKRFMAYCIGLQIEDGVILKLLQSSKVLCEEALELLLQCNAEIINRNTPEARLKAAWEILTKKYSKASRVMTLKRSLMEIKQNSKTLKEHQQEFQNILNEMNEEIVIQQELGSVFQPLSEHETAQIFFNGLTKKTREEVAREIMKEHDNCNVKMSEMENVIANIAEKEQFLNSFGKATNYGISQIDGSNEQKMENEINEVLQRYGKKYKKPWSRDKKHQYDRHRKYESKRHRNDQQDSTDRYDKNWRDRDNKYRRNNRYERNGGNKRKSVKCKKGIICTYGTKCSFYHPPEEWKYFVAMERKKNKDQRHRRGSRATIHHIKEFEDDDEDNESADSESDDDDDDEDEEYDSSSNGPSSHF